MPQPGDSPDPVPSRAPADVSVAPSAKEDPTRAGPHPWRQQKPRILAPAGYEYGILLDGQLVPSMREEMQRRAAAGQLFPMGWSPESPWLVWAEELPWVYPEIRTRLHAEARRQARPFVIGTVVAVIAVVAGLAGWAPVAVLMNAAPVWPLFFGILAAWTGARMYEAHRTARLTPEGFRAEVDDALHGTWLRHQRAPATTVLRYTFLGIGAAQFVAEQAGRRPDLAAALVKVAVRDGELWRLLTAGYLHGGILHFFLNFGALLWLGQLVETHANRAALGLVFLLTIVTGNIASTLLMPDTLALGASTGLMGLIGFLAIVAWRRRERVPAGLLRTILTNVAIIGSIGVIGSGVIDNAGHFGGLIGGLLLGVLITPAVRPGEGVGWAPSRALQIAGTGSLAILVAGAAATAAYLFIGPY